MRLRFLLLLAILVVMPLSAAPPAKPLDLQTYLQRFFPHCPDSKVEVERIQAAGPSGFVPYRVRLTSSATGCGRETFALVSPASNQVLVADVFTLPKDPRRVEQRIGEVAERMLKKPARVSLETSALQDGLTEVTITVDGKEGPFDFRGYLDGSRSFLIVGRRGKLDVDPRKSLAESLSSTAAVRRGKGAASIRIVELSDFQCPSCKLAHDLLKNLIEKNLGRISYTRIDLPIYEGHDWAIYAALAARAIQRISPQHYWAFVDYIFANQAAITRQHIDTFVRDFVEAHDIDWNKVSAMYKSPAERKAVLEQVERLYGVGIFATPTYVVNGQEIYYGKEASYLKQYLEKLLKK